MPRDTRLTLWPEQMAYYPLTNSWAEIKNISAIDFSQCLGAHSCGLAATALNLHSLFNSLSLNKTKTTNQKIKQLSILPEREPEPEPEPQHEPDHEHNNFKISTIYKHKNNELMRDCVSLGFFNSIKTHLSNDISKIYCSYGGVKKINSNYFSLNTWSFPIYHLDFKQYPTNRRNIIEKVLDFTEPIFDEFFLKNQDRGNQLNHVLEEITKNIADHSKADGFMGIDVISSVTKKTLSILIGDLGPGIYNHICTSAIAKHPSRKNKMGLSEAYKWALTNEVSGGNSPENYGCGMSTIVNNCLGLKAHISVFDEASRIILSSLPPIDQTAPTHNSVWRSSLRFDGKKPFFYFIQCEEITS